MANTKRNAGIGRLAGVMTERIRQQAEPELVLDFGSIQDDYSLLTDDYPIPIPPKDYLVCRSLTLGTAGAGLGGTDESGIHTHSGGDHTHDGGIHSGHIDADGGHLHSGGVHTHSGDGTHTHMVLIPEKLRSLKPGDRVLVAWRGSDAVVIDLILPASVL